MDRATIEVYEREAARWIRERGTPKQVDEVTGLARSVEPGAWRADLGCGPGWHAPRLGEGGPVVALDATSSMVERVRDHAPDAHVVRGDLEALPFRSATIAAAWAKASYQHVPMTRVPLALADLHRSLRVGGSAIIRVTSDRRDGSDWIDPFGARHFSYWSAERFGDVLVGAGFGVEQLIDDSVDWLTAHITRRPTLADVVADEMRLLIVGLNPSIDAAQRGVGFARAGNRFWPALIASGRASRDRDPHHALRTHGIGFTDLVKRATVRAAELDPAEYVEGAARVRRLVAWLEPDAVLFAGLSGYRTAVDRGATAGWQSEPFGGRPSYVMPNPSGLNGHTNVADLARHLRAAVADPR